MSEASQTKSHSPEQYDQIRHGCGDKRDNNRLFEKINTKFYEGELLS